jgi:hypothetical protein
MPDAAENQGKRRVTKKGDSRSGWTIKPGPTPETREACKKAARRQGLTLSAWIEQTLRQAATEDLKSGAVGPTQDEMQRQMLELMQRQDERLRSLEEERRQPWFRRLLGR